MASHQLIKQNKPYFRGISRCKLTTVSLVLLHVVLLGPLVADPARAADAITQIFGRVVGVHDGDTITVRTQTNQTIKVRLLGIDAPELGQPFGTKSKQALSNLVFGKDVLIASSGNDRYARVLGDIRVGRIWANQLMLQQGMAWHYKHFSKNARLDKAEADARAAKKGLWSDPDPAPPWEWRRGERGRKEPVGAK